MLVIEQYTTGMGSGGPSALLVVEIQDMILLDCRSDEKFESSQQRRGAKVKSTPCFENIYEHV
jgi:hypothetical protein